MAKKVARHVSATHEETGERRWFTPGQTVPAEYAGSITNPSAWESPEDATSDDETDDGGDGGGDTPPDVTDVPGGDQDPAGVGPTVEGDPDAEGEDPDAEGDDEPEDNYDDITNDERRAELARRDLPVHGNKDDLIARLRADDAEHADDGDGDGEA